MKNRIKIFILQIVFIFMFAFLFSSCSSNKTDDNTNQADEIALLQAEITKEITAGTEQNENITYKFSAKEIADTIMSAFSYEDIPQMRNFVANVSEDSEFYLEPDYAGVIMTGRYGAPDEMNYAVDFAFYTPLGQNVFEIDIIKLDDRKNKSAVTEMLQKRLTRKKSGDIIQYNPEELPMLNAAIVIGVEDYVMLLCTPDNNKALNIVTDLLDGNINLLKNIEPEVKPPLEPEIETTTEAKPEPKPEPETEPEVKIEAEVITETENKIIEDKVEGNNIVPEEIITPPVDNGVVDVPPNVIFDLSLLTPEEKSDLPNDEITSIPVIKVNKHSHNEMILIGGRCSQGAKIRVTGGLEEILTGSDFGDFLVEVPIPKEGVTELKVSAKVEGKEWSDEIKFVVKAKKDVTMFEESGIYAVIVGDDYQSVFYDCVPDYIGSNLIKDNEKTALQARVEKKYQDLRGKGLNTEIIYFLIPTPMNIYAELMPKRYTRFTENSLTKQFTEAVTAGGATVIDLTDTMMSHKHDEFKIYFKTDSHWTEYGAYWGYVDLMNYISKKFPDAAPRPITDFHFYNKQVNFGDIYHTLRLEMPTLKETAPFVDFKFDPPCGHANLYNNTQGESVVFDHNVMSKARTTKTNLSGNFPKAYIFRDSFGGSIYAYLTDRFSEITWQAYWNYKYDINAIAKANPDYIIYLITERNIKSIIYE